MTMPILLSEQQPEALLIPLLKMLAQPLSHPLAEDWLIVPSQCLEHWLNQQLAQQLGICSGIQFLRPEQALRRLLNSTEQPWPERGQLVWALLRQLDHLPEDSAFSLLRSSLNAGRAFELAEQLATLFENYAFYRPALLRQWQAELPPVYQPVARWQAWLWRNLPPAYHLPDQLSQRLTQQLPERLQFFACRHLPTLFQEVLTLPEFQTITQIYQLTEQTRSSLTAQAEIHAVSSPLRELEVLRDALLDALNQDSQLLPEEILIAVPDLRAYSAFVPFVFSQEPVLSVRIQGQRPLETGSALLQAFESILRLLDSRLPLSAVLATLDLEPVARRFGLDQSERELCRHWLEGVAIRWGWDERQRQELTTVAFGENSWQKGLRRLLLGYLLPLNDQEQAVSLLHGIAPYPDLEGSQGQTLGKLLDFLDALAEARTQLRQKRSLKNWGRALLGVLSRFTRPQTQQQAEWEQLSHLLDQLYDAPDLGPQSLSRVRTWLRARLNELEPQGHPGGGIRLAPISWCEGLSAKMICVLGLNDRGFPRNSGQSDLNLLNREPQAGDPDPGQQDREGFSGLLQRASQRLWLSYHGISQSDGSHRPPSLLLADLLENWPNWKHQAEIIRHPLYPYDLRAFTADSPPSFRADSLALALQLENREAAADFCAERLEPLLPEVISLPELLTFWRNPASAFLRARLTLGYGFEAEPGIDSEALELDNLESFRLSAHLIGPAAGLEAEYARLVAQSRLPVGRLGRIRFEELANDAQHFARNLTRFEAGETPRPLEFKLSLAGLHLEGELKLWPDGLRLNRQGKLRSEELLEAWIQHLVLQSLPETRGLSTRLLGKNEAKRLLPVVNAQSQLEAIIQLTLEGLMRPLAYFPRTSMSFAEERLKGRASEQALMIAENTWVGSKFSRAEQGRPEWQVCFREDPLNSDFMALAEAIWLPLLEVLVDDADS